MQYGVRHRGVTGLGLLGAGVIAVSPIAPSLPDAQVPALPDVHSTAVQLTADVNPLTAWIDAINTASGNATQLADSFFEAPGAVWQQVIVNQMSHLGEFIADPTRIGDILTQVAANVQAAWDTGVLVGADADTIAATTPQTLDDFHSVVFTLLPTVLDEDLGELETQLITQVVNFAASPLSGVLIGLAGPVASPAVAFANSIQTIADAFAAEDPAAAFQAVIDTPANMVDGFLNGATLNLDVLAPVVNGAGLLKEGTTIDNLSLGFGGLLTPGQPLESDIGGSIFNSLGLTVSTEFVGVPITLPVEANPVGPLAAMTALSHVVAKAIGWDGEGNPLTDLTLPTLPTGPDIEDPATHTSMVSAATIATPEKALTATPEKASAPTSPVTATDTTSTNSRTSHQRSMSLVTKVSQGAKDKPGTSTSAADSVKSAEKHAKQSKSSKSTKSGGKHRAAKKSAKARSDK